MIEIREAGTAEIDLVVSVVRDAFADEVVVTQLVGDLLADQSAQPILSLLAYKEQLAVGHVLFTAAHLENHSEVRTSILAPLSVVPSMQSRRIGTELTEKGLELLAVAGTEFVFVLGYPDYYQRFGFSPAGPVGLQAPYPIEEKNADAWMVLALGKKESREVSGVVRCAQSLNKAEYWRE